MKVENDVTALQSDGSVPGDSFDPLADTEILVDKCAVLKEEPSQPYRCSQCSKQLTHQRNLRKHIRVLHMAAHVRTFFCVMCRENFRGNSWSERHIRSHTKEKPNHCPRCHREFRIPRNLLSHIRVHHLGESPARHKCRFCSKLLLQNMSSAREQTPRKLIFLSQFETMVDKTANSL